MSVLRNLEQKLAGLVEGGFGRAFRTEGGVSEIARRRARLQRGLGKRLGAHKIAEPVGIDCGLQQLDGISGAFAGLAADVAIRGDLPEFATLGGRPDEAQSVHRAAEACALASYEIVVCNNDSTDGTAEGARAAGAHVTVIALRDYPLPLYDADEEAQQGLQEALWAEQSQRKG